MGKNSFPEIDARTESGDLVRSDLCHIGKIRRTAGLLACATVAVAGFGLAGCGYESGGGTTNITYVEHGNPGSLKNVDGYYAAIEKAGSLCPADFSENYIVGQLVEEDVTQDATIVSGANAIGAAQWTYKTMKNAFKQKIITYAVTSGNSVDVNATMATPYYAILDMVQFDCHNAKVYGGRDAALRVYVSGNPNGGRFYSDDIDNIAGTVQFSRNSAHTGGGDPSNPTGGGKKPGDSFRDRLRQAGYSVSWVHGGTASAPFPDNPGCPAVTFRQVGSGWSVNVDDPGFTSVPQNTSASLLKFAESGFMKCES